MGLSNSVIILLCILAAAGTAVIGASTHRFFVRDPEEERVQHISREQLAHLNQVRERNLDEMYQQLGTERQGENQSNQGRHSRT